MYLVKYRGKLLFHGEICDYPSLISTKKLDIEKDKSLVKRLFGRLRRSSALKAEKIRRILASILDGQRTLPEVFYGTAVNRALAFLRRGLFKVHRKTNTSIDYSEVEPLHDLEMLYLEGLQRQT